MKSIRLAHPIVLLLAAVPVAALLTWILQTGDLNRHKDGGTGGEVVVADTYHSVPATPVGM